MVYFSNMDEAQLIWRLARWIGRRESGAARLSWTGGEVIVRLHCGRVVSIDGIDPSLLATRLGCQPAGHKDLLEEGRALAKAGSISETQAIGTAKEILQEAIHTWILEPGRRLDLVEGQPDIPEGPSISITHAIVELILSDTTGRVHAKVLPDLEVLLRRSPKFIELYAPLRLSEDADLIVAKITGQRTAKEIAEHSPHQPDEVLRLLGALVAAGMLEPVPVALTARHLELSSTPVPEDETKPRRLPVGWIVAALAVVGIALGVLGYFLAGSRGAQVEEVGTWGIVVDMGCEPQDLQRVLKRAEENPTSLRAVRATLDQGNECWRLVWGAYPSKSLADEALQSLPDNLVRGGFQPHSMELEPEPTETTGARPQN